MEREALTKVFQEIIKEILLVPDLAASSIEEIIQADPIIAISTAEIQEFRLQCLAEEAILTLELTLEEITTLLEEEVVSHQRIQEDQTQTEDQEIIMWATQEGIAGIHLIRKESRPISQEDHSHPIIEDRTEISEERIAQVEIN